MNEKPRLTIKKWRSYRKNTLCGFADVRLPIGLTIRDVTVHANRDKAWASMPAKPILDEEGRHATTREGKKNYAFILEWDGRDISDRFSHAVIAALDETYPEWRN